MEITLNYSVLVAISIIAYIGFGIWSGRWAYRSVKKQWMRGDETMPPPTFSSLFAFLFWPTILPFMIVYYVITWRNEPPPGR